MTTLSLIVTFAITIGAQPRGALHKTPEDFITVGAVPRLADIDKESGAGVLLRSEEAYRNLKSYQGSISTKRSTTRAGAVETLEHQAKIAYESPGKLRLDATKDGESYSIISDGKTHWGVSPASGVKKYENAADALSTYQGVLQQRTIRLPSLLANVKWNRENMFLPNGRLLTALASKAQVRGEEAIAGNACYVIDCERSIGTWSLWIDKKSLLVRRFDTSWSPGQMRVQRANGGGGTLGLIQKDYCSEIYEIESTNQEVDDGIFTAPKEEVPAR